ncbi:MAG: T9SS type A sorting domain-containing protein [Flavobacteriales bacterium]|nr:T9SS type A sorting domain-containing protein [Flavobacteriales bacterium]
MKKITLIFFAFSLSFIAQGQHTFFKVYGDAGYDYCRDLIEGVDSSYFLTGSSSSFGGETADAYIMKIDSMGDFKWSHNYGGPGTEWGQALVLTIDSSFALTGYTNSYGEGGFDFYLVRAAADGTPLWEKTYGGSDWDRAYDLVQLPDSGFVMVGETYSFGNGLQKGYMVRTDKNGDTLWTKLFDGVGESFLKGIFMDEVGDSLVICGGSSHGGAGMLDGYVAKMDLDGNIGWEYYIGEMYDDYFNDIYGDPSLGFYALGGAQGYTYPDTKEDIWMVKLDDQTGAVVFDTTNTTASSEPDIVNAVWLRPTIGDMYYAGQTRTWGFAPIDGNYDFYFGKRNSGGGHTQSKIYGERGDDAAHAILQAYDKGTIVAGDTKYYSTGGNNIMVVKMELVWAYPDVETDLVYDNVTTSLTEQKQTFGLRLYPNPVENELIIEAEKPVDLIEVYSFDGRLVLSENGQQNLDLSFLESGTYIVRVEIEGHQFTKQIIRN